MANYDCASRTSYFKTTDEERLRVLVKDKIGAELFTRDDGTFAFGAYEEITSYWDEESGCDNDIFEELQKIIPDDEAVVIFQSGHENLRYVDGYVFIVTKTNLDFMSIIGYASERVKEITGREPPRMSY